MKNIDNKIVIIVAICAILINRGFAFAKPQEDILFTSTFKNYEKIRVSRVISADLIELKSGEKIRLIGLKAPIPPQKKDKKRDRHGFVIKDTSPFTTIEDSAFEFAQSLLEDKFIRIEFDKKRKDNNFITLGYVFLLDGTFVNTEILRQGFANLHIHPSNKKYAKELRAAYQEARREKRGLQGE